MFAIDTRSRLPVYEQLIRQIEEQTIKGLLKTGEQIPSVRALSMVLAVNPNTVARAYSELEKRGVVTTLTGRGSFIAQDAAARLKEEVLKKPEALIRLVTDYKNAGMAEEDFVSLVHKIYQ